MMNQEVKGSEGLTEIERARLHGMVEMLTAISFGMEHCKKLMEDNQFLKLLPPETRSLLIKSYGELNGDVIQLASSGFGVKLVMQVSTDAAGMFGIAVDREKFLKSADRIQHKNG